MIALGLLLGVMAVPVDLAQPTEDPLYLSDEAKGFFEARVNRGAPAMERLQMILGAVFSEDGLGFTYREQTLPAETIFRERSGNCLSFTLFMVAVGREFGLPFRFREVEIAPTWSKIGNVIAFNEHINAIVQIGANSYVVDLLPVVNRIEIRGHVVSDERGLAHFYSNQGAEILAHGDAATAMLCFERALQYDPGATFVWGNIGVAKTKLGELKDAEQAYLTAINLDRANLVALSNLGQLFLRTGRQREAADIRQKIADFRNRNPYYHFGLGMEALEAGRIQASVGFFKEALKRKNREPNFHHALARAYVLMGDISGAVKELKKAVEFAPDEKGRERYSQKLEILASAYSRP